MNSNNEHGPDSGLEVDPFILATRSRLSGRGHVVLASVLGLCAGLSERGAEAPPLTGGLPSWLADYAFPSPTPSSPNGRAHTGIAAAKRLARKRKNQRKAKRSLRG